MEVTKYTNVADLTIETNHKKDPELIPPYFSNYLP